MRTDLHFSTALLVLLGSGVVACGDDDGARVPPGDEVRSSKARVVDPGVSPEALRALTGANAAFALDLLHAEQPEGNFFCSPHSISLALAMTYGGARGETERQMADALHFDAPQAELHPAFNALDQELASRERATPEHGGEVFRLRIVNAIWGQRGYAFLPTYLDLLAESYGAGLSLLDFAADPEAARLAINGWVSLQTEARIPELLPVGVVDAMTVLVLTNAIYFHASWDQPFEPAATVEGEFRRLDGSAVRAPLMHARSERRYAEGDGWRAVELPYAGGQVSMLVVLPDEGTFVSFEERLDAGALDDVVAALDARAVDLTLPRFTFRTELGLAESLQRLGMRDAFSGAADLSGMDGTRTLFVQDVVHEAWVAVDEEGTEAAAATAVVIGRTSAPEPATLTADHPFLFVIRDGPTGAVLFLGRVVDPS